jgi:putative addiction module component (TIGR02574 family)
VIRLTDAQKTELARRMARCETHPNAWISWEQLKAELPYAGR